MRILILGGARSGKSRYAHDQATGTGLDVVYVATAWAGDDEMHARIARHRKQRPAHWQTVEEHYALASSLVELARADRCLIVECLTLWLSNLLAEDQARFRRERAALLETLPGLPGTICLVSNEVGQGVVPANPLARRFVDEAGWLHQDLARLCERVVWVIAGLPHILKDSP